MQIRRYVGAELPAVLAQINRELGPNAAILNTRKISQGGFFGILGRSAVEVTVAVDYEFRLSPDRPARAPAPAPSAFRPAPARSVPEAAPSVARRELNEMRVKPRGAAPAAAESGPALSEELERIHRMMVRNQVESDVARQLLRVFDEQLALLGEDWRKAQPRFEQYVAGMLRCRPGIELREGRKPLVAMFIGPTGVGKTTTIAKIASQFSLMEHRRVAIVTADTYRMGATDQMRRYGEILGIPVTVVESPEEMEQAVLHYAGYDLLLVDTAGRSPQNKEQILQLKRMVEAARPDEIHLVMSMTTKYVDVVSIVSRFGIVPVNRAVLTKFDETRTFGTILNLSMKFSMEIAYLSTGQQVPDDLELADPKRLARLVLTGVSPEPPPQGNGRPGLPAA